MLVARHTLLDAVSSTTTYGDVDLDQAAVTAATIYVEWSTGATAGKVRLEQADSTAFMGAWALIQDVSWSASDSQDAVNVPGPFGAIRARAVDAISNGSVTVKLKAVGPV